LILQDKFNHLTAKQIDQAHGVNIQKKIKKIDSVIASLLNCKKKVLLDKVLLFLFTSFLLLFFFSRSSITVYYFYQPSFVYAMWEFRSEPESYPASTFKRELDAVRSAHPDIGRAEGNIFESLSYCFYF
jgi:hypothetical protein